MTEKTRSKVLIRSVAQAPLNAAVRQLMDGFDWETWVQPNSTVVIKPNVCTAVPGTVVGGNTNPAVVRAVCEILLTRTRRICIGEARHMRQTTHEAFQASGYVELARDLGVELIDFSAGPFTMVDCPPAGKISLPSIILEAGAYINMPVLKTHALTYFTGALKNQWGCVPDYLDRLRHHRQISQMLSSLQRIFKPKLIVMDATFGMEGRGPVAGPIRQLDTILASPDPVALDSTAMRMVGLDPKRAGHLVLAAAKGLGHFDEAEIDLDGDWEQCRTRFEPPPRDFANTAMFFLTSHDWFTKKILANDRIYYPIANTVKFLRRKGVLGG